MSDQRGPVILDLDTTPLPEAPRPAEAPPVDPPELAGAGADALRLVAQKRSRGGPAHLVWWALGALVSLAVGVAVFDFISGLFARHLWLGTVGSVLLVIAGLGFLGLIVRELAALSRLKQIADLQAHANAGETAPLIAGLTRLYANRPDLEAARSKVEKTVAETPDAETLIATLERQLMAPLDRRAADAIRQSVRAVGTATALIPMPVVDILAVLWSNLRMIRQIAEIYGGRTGWFGSLRLLRAVAVHLLATGAVSAADDILGPLVGGGVLGKLSRRFGEATVNAALTARVGVAALEVSRPMPFAHLSAPGTSSLVLDALRTWRSDKDDEAKD